LADKLYLFDIDGTLIHAGKTPSLVFADTISTVIGEPVFFPKGIFFGRTDMFIIKEMLKRTNRPLSDGYYDQIRDHFVEKMKTLFPGSSDGYIIPGAKKFLDRLQKDSSVTRVLVTGNFRETAYVKLTHFGLHEYFTTGGFGDDAEDRPELVRQAVFNATRFYKKTFTPENITVIGDTIHDIQSAHYWGYRSVAVSWIRDKDELLKAQPDILIENFEELMDGKSYHY
jgi:phosphoglycolate phosphatase